jgi:prephenate dehydrogenase
MSQKDDLKIGIVGLGLIGGSLARAYKEAGCTVFGYDMKESVVDYALLSGAIDKPLTDEQLTGCDRIFIAIPPLNAIEWLKGHAGMLTHDNLVIDCCGTKRDICDTAFRLMEETDLVFVGGHPMAGKEQWGLKFSSSDIYEDATFVVVLKDRNDIRLIEKVKSTLKLAGFGKIVSMTAEEHDSMIAFTSQLSHIVSSAFAKGEHLSGDGTAIAGGSFRDMTRVAYLNEEIWTELCMENRDSLLVELTRMIDDLDRFKEALENGDEDTLRKLFAEGKKQREKSNA